MNKKVIRRKKINTDYLSEEIPEIIRQIYASRGVKSPLQLELKVNNLQGLKFQKNGHNDSLKGLDDACPLLHTALTKNTNIVIVGDFDADGATSTALMMVALSLMGSVNHSFLVPNRFEYGYGLTPEIVDIAAKQGAQLLVTVDNGISCVAGVNRAKELGIKVLVTDHHLPGHELP